MPVPQAPSWVPFRALAVVAAVALSSLSARRLDRSGRHLAGLRSRLLLGIPWGTVLTVLFVLAVYLFVQSGIRDFRNPVVIAFRSWSYFYPLGMVTAAFSHGGVNHLVGNLVGTAAFGGVAEYYWGHYPRDRGTATFSSLRTNPYARIVAVPAASVVVGLFTALFSLGAVIGFSGVVFAMAGFALVVRPLTTVLALVGTRVIDLVIAGLLNPSVAYSPRPRVSQPWWSQVAIHDHAIGLLAGVLLAAVVVRRRRVVRSPGRLWFAALAFAAFEGLWAVYVPLSGGRFLLFRWAGVAAVFTLVPVLMAAVDGHERPLVARIGLDRREAATGFLFALLIALSLVAVPYNVAPVGSAPAPGPTVSVRDYSVGYGENVSDEYVGAVDVPLVDLTDGARTSGVIVTSERRSIWYTRLTAAAVANQGESRIELGGIGWRDAVYINRTGWSVQGNDTVYKVFLRADGPRRLGFSSPASRASPTVAGRNVIVAPTADGFRATIARDGEALGGVPMPPGNTTVRVGGIVLERNERTLYAVTNRSGDPTRVQVARRMP